MLGPERSLSAFCRLSGSLAENEGSKVQATLVTVLRKVTEANDAACAKTNAAVRNFHWKTILDSRITLSRTASSFVTIGSWMSMDLDSCVASRLVLLKLLMATRPFARSG